MMPDAKTETRAEPSARPRARVRPLSHAQESFCASAAQPPESVQHLAIAIRLAGHLDIAALERAVGALIEHHEILRTRFARTSAGPSLVVEPGGGPVLTLTEVPGETAEAREAAASEAYEELRRRPFDVAAAPPLRVVLLRVDDLDHILTIVAHRLIADADALGILAREIIATYRDLVGGLVPAPSCAPPLQYTEYAASRRQRLSGMLIETQLAHWQKRLANAATALELPTDRPRPAMPSGRTAEVAGHIPADVAEALAHLSRAEGTTALVALVTAFAVVLSRWSGQEDMLVGTAIAGRSSAALKALIGPVANILALRTDLTGNPSFRALLRRLKETVLEAEAHGDVPFDMVVEKACLERDASRHPLVQAMIHSPDFGIWSTLESVLDALPGVEGRLLALHHATGSFDLALDLRHESGGYDCRLSYASDLFDADTARRLLQHYLNVLRGAAADPDCRLAELPLLTATEMRQLLVDWNGAAAEYPKHCCVHDLFAQQAARAPANKALCFEGQELSYDELEARSNQIAHHLQSLGIGPDCVVALILERSLAPVVGLLAILKAGGAYLPLDPDYPQERLAYLLRNAQVSVVLTQAALAEKLAGTGVRSVCLDADDAQIALHPRSAPASGARPESLACIIYTSGSTGEPKGVMIEHRQILNYTYGLRRQLPFEGLRNFAMVQSFTVASTFSVIYPSLLFGATLHVLSRERLLDADACGRYFDEQGVECVKIAPSHLATLVAVSKSPRDLLVKLVILGGEPSPAPWAASLLAVNPDCHIVNHYGITESAITGLTYRVGPDLPSELPTVPLGRPLPNCRAYVLDSRLALMPPGAVGEIHLAGDSLARGYLGAPELTAARFIRNPFSDQPGDRLYRTHDLGRWRRDGSLQIVGRKDNQVKIRGFRVELGEVEAALSSHPKVRQAAVSVQTMSPTERRLIAYVVPKSGTEPSFTEVSAYLRQRLPEFMVPADMLVLAALPRTAHGKLDRKALPMPKIRAEVAQYLAPRTATEATLAAIWSEVLQLARVGAHDNFFEIGGNSLLATRMIAQVRDKLAPWLPLTALFKARSLAELADRIDTQRIASHR